MYVGPAMTTNLAASKPDPAPLDKRALMADLGDWIAEGDMVERSAAQIAIAEALKESPANRAIRIAYAGSDPRGLIAAVSNHIQLTVVTSPGDVAYDHPPVGAEPHADAAPQQHPPSYNEAFPHPLAQAAFPPHPVAESPSSAAGAEVSPQAEPAPVADEVFAWMLPLAEDLMPGRAQPQQAALPEPSAPFLHQLRESPRQAVAEVLPSAPPLSLLRESPQAPVVQAHPPQDAAPQAEDPAPAKPAVSQKLPADPPAHIQAEERVASKINETISNGEFGPRSTFMHPNKPGNTAFQGAVIAALSEIKSLKAAVSEELLMVALADAIVAKAVAGGLTIPSSSAIKAALGVSDRYSSGYLYNPNRVALNYSSYMDVAIRNSGFSQALKDNLSKQLNRGSA